MAVLMTMGELATVAGTQLRADVPEILPLVIDAIQDGGSQTKRLVAVSTLGQVGAATCLPVCLPCLPACLHLHLRLLASMPWFCGLLSCALSALLAHPTTPLPACALIGLQVVESTGFVVMPYLEYPQLLGVLLRMLSEGAVTVRREVMKVLGIIGALDPHTHKLNLAQLQGEGRLEREGVRPQFPNKNPTELGE